VQSDRQPGDKAAYLPRAVAIVGQDEEATVFDGLHHMQLALARGEEDAVRRFTVGVLGMAEIGKPPVLAARGGAWFRAGGLELHLGVEDGFRPAPARGTPASSSTTLTTWYVA